METIFTLDSPVPDPPLEVTPDVPDAIDGDVVVVDELLSEAVPTSNNFLIVETALSYMSPSVSKIPRPVIVDKTKTSQCENDPFASSVFDLRVWFHQCQVPKHFKRRIICGS